MTHRHEFEEWLQKQIEPEPVVIPHEETEKRIQKTFLDIQSELNAWETYTVKHLGRANKRPFNPEATRGDLADFIQGRLADLSDKHAIMDMFDDMKEVAAFKTIQATRLDFENDFEDLLRVARSGEVNRRTWSARVRRLINIACQKAFRDGMRDGGVDAEPDDVERDYIAEHISSQSQYVANLGDLLFNKDGISDAQALLKPEMWFNKSIRVMYYDGFESASANQMMEFYGKSGEESCSDCTRLIKLPDRHRLKDWKRNHMRPQVDFEYYECGDGGLCEHGLRPVRGKEQGSY